MMVNTLKNKLRSIPHLPFPLFFDHEKIKEEIDSIPFGNNKYVSGFRKNKHMGIFDNDNNWESYALYSINGDIYSDPDEGWTESFKQTKLIDYCPYTYETIHSFGGGKLLSRIEKIMPGHSVGWHSHVLEGGGFKDENILTMHLPVCIPKESKYSVVSYTDYCGSDYSKSIKTYESTYRNGQVYCLNSYHYHNAFNYSDIPMVMIRFYIDINVSKNYEMVETAVKQYSGDHIETYENYISRLENE